MVARLRQSDWHSWLPERLVELGLCLTVLLFARWQHPPASLLLLLVAAALAWIRLEIAIALLPLTLPYYLDPEPFRSSGSPAFSVGELGILICVGVALLRTAVFAAERNATWEWLRGLWQQARFFLPPAALLLIGASLALLATPDLRNSLRDYRWEIIEPLLYFLLLLRYLRTRADLARTMVALVLAGLIVSSTAIIQGLLYLKDHGALITSATSTFRPSGPYGSPNNLALLLDRVIPIVLAVGLTHLWRRSTAPEAMQRLLWRDPLRWACVLALIPLVWALYWSRSRGAEVAILAVVVFFFLVEVRHWIALAAVFVAGLLGALFFRSRLLDLFDTGHNGTETLSERFTYWKAALLIIRDHFFLGTGPNSFGTQYNPHSPNSYALKALNSPHFPSNYDPGISHPHNMILDLWISTGLLGLAAMGWLLGAVAIRIMRLYRLCSSAHSSDLLPRLVLGIAGSVIAAVVHGMEDNFYFVPDLAALFWFFIAIVLMLEGIALGEQTLAKEKDSKTPLATPITKASD